MRVFFKEGSNVLEISKQINRYKSDTYLMSLSTSDGIYIASDYPLNHFYIKMGAVKNESPSNVIIDYWSASGWNPVVHQNDYTEAFSQSGFIEFTPDRDASWTLSNSNSNGQNITGLENITVYDKYWTRITVDADLDDNIELEFIGNIFSDDEDLFSEFPIFNDSNFLSCFESGKTDWQEQHVKAADLIIQDLKRKGIIMGPEKILDRDVLLPASVCKVAEIIFNAFGKEYEDQIKRARNEYDKRLDLSNYLVDTNNNGIMEAVDVSYKQGWLSR
jgi:hypothetical protein